MFHVTCTLPNAPLLINGIKFRLVDEEEHDVDPVRTVRTLRPVDEATASQFKGIPGYAIEPAAGAPPAPAERDVPRRGPGRPRKAEVEARAAASAPPAQPPSGNETRPDDDTGPSDGEE